MDARSRPGAQLVENSDGPKGLVVPGKPVLCGIEPALRRERDPVLPPPAVVAVLALESIPETPGGRNGLVDGVGREVWDMSDSFGVPTGEKREGTVPALVLRAEALKPPFEVGIKSGKPSWLGDSGIFSRRGVEWPLVGGPQILGEIPSCAWISRALDCRLH